MAFKDWFQDVIETYHTKIVYVLLAICAILLFAVLAGCGSSGPIPPADGQQGVDTLTWTNPDQWEDGSPLTDAQLDDILIQWGPSGGPYNVGSQTVVAGAPGASQSITVDRQTLGTRCYVAFAIADGISSNASAEACKTIRGRPNTPAGLTVN